MAEQQSINSPLSLTLLDPNVLDCPICCEPLKIPIFQCENGHLACSPCCEKVESICLSFKRDGYSRCRAMEKVIKATRVSCPNAKYGCKEIVSYENPSIHENQCFFAPCSCPVRDCNYTASDKDLYNHVRAKHKDDLNVIAWDTPLNIVQSLQSHGSNEKITFFMDEKDRELFVVQAFRRSNGLAVSASCIATLAPRLIRFSCCLKFATWNLTLKQAFMLREIPKVSEEPEDGFMLVPSHLLPSDVNVSMSIRFSRGPGCIDRA